MSLAEDLLVFDEERASRVANASVRKLREWDAKDVVRPRVSRSWGRRRLRLYGFHDLVEVLAVQEMRDRGVSFQQIRRVLEYLRGCGYESPLREIEFAIEGREVFFKLPDGIWSGGKEPSQLVYRQVLNLEPLRAKVHNKAHSRLGEPGQVERRRGRVSRKPVFEGTRMPVETVQAWLSAGRSEAEILDAYPGLSERDVREATRLLSSA